MSPANRLLIQVVPRLTPARCGVSDQAVLLARELKTAFGIDAAFVVLNSDERCDLPYPMIHCQPGSLLNACLSLGQSQPGAVLVHVSGYGYAADGAPTRLAEALAKLKTSGQFRIAAYFHELFATGMPWKSAFWYSRRQRKAVHRIAEECNLLVTNLGRHAKWLGGQPIRRSDTPVQLLPVFSIGGETQDPIPIAQREPAMAVFGLFASRQRAYRELSFLGGMLMRLGIKEIVDIGPESRVPHELNGVPVRRMGVLAPRDLGSQLSKTRFGFLSYPSLAIAKSSIFAAYCAQGTIPVIAKHFHGEVDGLRDGVHLLSPQTVKAAQAPGLEHCSLAAWQWYQGHRLHVHAATYARWLDHPANSVAAETRIPAKVKGI